MQIVVCTGQRLFPPELRDRTTETLTELFIKEIEVGIDDPAATLSWQKRVESVKRLIDAGFVDKIFFSNDWVHGDVEREEVNPDGMLFTLRKTIPYLKTITKP